MSWIDKFVVLLMPALQNLFPGFCARQAYRLWFYTLRFNTPQRELAWLGNAEEFFIPFKQHRIACYRWGNRDLPCVLLAHGWNGRGSQLGGFVSPLIRSGFQVLAFDGPGHGKSSGHKTSLIEISECISALVKHEDLVPAAIIGHSGGAVSSMLHLRRNHDHDSKLVTLGAPTRAPWLIDVLLGHLRLDKKLKPRIAEQFQRQFGDDVLDRVSLEKQLPRLTQPVMIIHDHNDRDVPFHFVRQLQESAPGAEYLFTTGLGHRKILRDEDTINPACSFIADTENRHI